MSTNNSTKKPTQNIFQKLFSFLTWILLLIFSIYKFIALVVFTAIILAVYWIYRQYYRTGTSMKTNRCAVHMGKKNKTGRRDENLWCMRSQWYFDELAKTIKSKCSNVLKVINSFNGSRKGSTASDYYKQNRSFILILEQNVKLTNDIAKWFTDLESAAKMCGLNHALRDNLPAVLYTGGIQFAEAMMRNGGTEHRGTKSLEIGTIDLLCGVISLKRDVQKYIDKADDQLTKLTDKNGLILSRKTGQYGGLDAEFGQDHDNLLEKMDLLIETINEELPTELRCGLPANAVIDTEQLRADESEGKRSPCEDAFAVNTDDHISAIELSRNTYSALVDDKFKSLEKADLIDVIENMKSKNCPCGMDWMEDQWVKKTAAFTNKNCPEIPSRDKFILKTDCPPETVCPACICAS